MSLTVYRADGTPKETDYLATPSTLDTWHQVGAAGEPAFQNGWVNFDAVNLSAVAFRRFPDGTIRLKGQVKNGTAGAVIFTLPSGYRPPIREDFAPSGSTIGQSSLAIMPSGDIAPGPGQGNGRVSLDGLTFDTETVGAWQVPAGTPDVPLSSDSWATNGPGIGAAWVDLGVVNRTLVLDGQTTVEAQGIVRIGGNTDGALLHLHLGMDGAPGTGIEITYTNVRSMVGGQYVSAPIYGWYKPAAGSHNFKLYGYASSGLANMDAAHPSFLSMRRRP